MADIKLARLPDRTPVKLTISLTPDQSRLLNDYATFYAMEHGTDVAPVELVPAVLEAFILGDRAFLRARRLGGLRGSCCPPGSGSHAASEPR